MARMHIMEQAGPNLYRIVTHAPTPNGNNAAGHPWATVLVNAGLARTEMIAGTGPGQITAAEAAEVQAGTVIEAGFLWQDDPAWTNPQRVADLNTRADQAVSATLADYGARLRWFGRTVA